MAVLVFVQNDNRRTFASKKMNVLQVATMMNRGAASNKRGLSWRDTRFKDMLWIHEFWFVS